MSQYRDLVVRIVGDAKGMKKATAEAESSLTAFGDRVGKLGSTMAGVFAGGALLSFAKTAAQAALEDGRAQERLAKTLQNVTGATREQIAAVEDYISATESQYAVLDDELRPAFETLVRATKDAGQAQNLLQLALDVSAGSGKSLQEVSVALVKAMNGQMRGLKDLGIQVKTTSGDTASFTDVQAQLNAMFAGQAAEAANSQTGKMKQLQIQYENTKEAIGRALLPVMLQLANIANSLFGWFNSLGEGTQRFIVQVVAFTGIAYAAVRGFVAIRSAIIAMNAAAAASPLGALAAAAGLVATLGMTFFGSGKQAEQATDYVKEYDDAITSLGFTANTATALIEAVQQAMKGGSTQETRLPFELAIKALNLSAEDTAVLLEALNTEGVTFTDVLARLSPKGQQAAVGLQAIVEHAARLPQEIEYGTTSIYGMADALTALELPMNSSQQAMQRWRREQRRSAEESEEWSKRTIAAFGSAFAYLEGLVNKDQALQNVADKLKDYREQVEKTGEKSTEALRAQNEYVLALANGAATAAAAVPGFDKLTEAQQKVAQARFINDWARNVQRTVEPGSPLWIALQGIINQVFALTGGSTSADMINAIDITALVKPKGKRAKGGPVIGGSAYVVGERGPELFVPGASGAIIPNGAGSGGSITVNVTAPTGTDPYAFGNAVVSALRSWVRVNGRLAGVAA